MDRYPERLKSSALYDDMNIHIKNMRMPGWRLIVCILSVFIISAALPGCAGGAKAIKKAVAMEDMGKALAAQGDSRGALVYFLKAEALDPDNANIQHELALSYENIEEYDLSLGHFKKAIDLRPNFSDAINNLGTLYSREKEWDKAMECFQKALSDKLYQTPHYAYHNMGLVYYYKGDYEKAVENYQKALRLEPSYLTVYYDLASAYAALNRYEDAVEVYKTASSLNPQSRQLALGLARLYIKMDRRDDAVKKLNEIIASDPRSQAAKEASQLLEELNKK